MSLITSELAGGIPGGVTSSSVTQMQTWAGAGSLIPGALYIIIDAFEATTGSAGSAQILVKAYSTTTIEKFGWGFYQNSFMVVPVKCTMEYDLNSDTILSVREPHRNNYVRSETSPNSLLYFKFDDADWNDNVLDNCDFNGVLSNSIILFNRNIVKNCFFTIPAGQTISMYDNNIEVGSLTFTASIVSPASTIVSNNNVFMSNNKTLTLSSETFSDNDISFDANVDASALENFTKNDIRIRNVGDMTFNTNTNSGTTISGKVANSNMSTFEQKLDCLDLAIFDGMTILTIPAGMQWVGRFYLYNALFIPVYAVMNAPNIPFRLYIFDPNALDNATVYSGLSPGSVPGEIILKGANTSLLINYNKDWVEFQKDSLGIITELNRHTDDSQLGPQGPQGFDGASGYSGKSGYSGYSGKSGVNGSSGFSGYSGTSGWSGTSGATGPSTVPINQSIFVSKSGNDGTGAAYDFSKHYLTITAAASVASAGDTIFVFPGTYNESDFATGDLNFYFYPGAVVTSSSGLILNLTGGTTVIDGYGEFIFTGSGGFGQAALYVNNADLYMRCKSLQATGSSICMATYQTGNVHIEADSITSNTGSVIQALSWSGMMNIKCKNISCAAPSAGSVSGPTLVAINGGFSGDFQLDADRATISGSISGHYIEGGTGSIKITYRKLISTYSGATVHSLFYLKDACPNVYINADIYAQGSTNAFKLNGTGSVFLDVKGNIKVANGMAFHYDRSGAVVHYTGDIYATTTEAANGSDKAAVAASSGTSNNTFRLTGSITQYGTGAHGIHSQLTASAPTNTIELLSAKIYVDDAGAYSVAGTTPPGTPSTNPIVVGTLLSNRTVDGNITVQGEAAIVGSYVTGDILPTTI